MGVKQGQDLRVVQRSDEKSIGEKNSAPKKDEEELRAEESSKNYSKELKSETSPETTSISSLILCIVVAALQCSNENELLHRFDKCSTSSHAGAWGTTSFKDPVGAWGDTCFEDPEVWGTTNPTTSDDAPWGGMMKSKIWKPFKCSEGPFLNDIPAGRSIMVL